MYQIRALTSITAKSIARWWFGSQLRSHPWGNVSRAFMTLILAFQVWMQHVVRNLKKPGLPAVYPSYQYQPKESSGVRSGLSVFFLFQIVRWVVHNIPSLHRTPFWSQRLFGTSIRIHWWLNLLNGVLCHPPGYWWQPQSGSLPMMLSINEKSSDQCLA